MAEPFAGYENLIIKGKTVGSTRESNSTGSGVAYGIRLGYSFGQFWLGGDYKGSFGSDDSDTGKTDYSQGALGVLFGYQVNKFNFWAGYGISDILTFKSTPELEFKGNNFKVGFNYQTPHKFNAGVELAFPTYDKVGTTGGEVDLNQVYTSFNVTSIMLMISYPFGGGK